jgi:hypothetical protein
MLRRKVSIEHYRSILTIRSLSWTTFPEKDLKLPDYYYPKILTTILKSTKLIPKEMLRQKLNEFYERLTAKKLIAPRSKDYGVFSILEIA